MTIVERIEKIKKFLKEVQQESKKVNWPKWEHLSAASTVVIVCMIAIAIFLGAIDYIFSLIFHWLPKLISKL